MFSEPQKNLEQFGIDKGMSVADIGAGSGHYVFAAASLVGHEGKVYAVDVQKELLVKLKREAERRKLNGVETILGDAEHAGGAGLADGTIDRAIVSNILFQADDKGGLVREVWRILKVNGKALVVDWTDSFSGMGPSAARVLSEQRAREIFEKEGFVFEKKIDAGNYHYGMIFKRGR